MTITSSLRFLYILGGSCLLCGVRASVRASASKSYCQRALFDPASTQLRARKASQQSSPYARAIIAAAPSSEPHLDIYFPIGSKTKGALQGPAFVRQYASTRPQKRTVQL